MPLRLQQRTVRIAHRASTVSIVAHQYGSDEHHVLSVGLVAHLPRGTCLTNLTWPQTLGRELLKRSGRPAGALCLRFCSRAFYLDVGNSWPIKAWVLTQLTLDGRVGSRAPIHRSSRTREKNA